MTSTSLIRRARQAALWAAVLFMTVQALFPIGFMIITSLKTRRDLFSSGGFWDFSITLENYRRVLEHYHFGWYMQNSLIVSVSATVLTLALGVLAAYGFSRYQFRGRNLLLIVVIGLRLVPPVSLVIPLFQQASALGITDTHFALALVNAALNLPFVIWMMRGFFDEIPSDLIAAARVDGCNSWTTFLRISLPLAQPGLFATAVFTFILTWNDFLFPLVLTSSNAVTLPVMAAQFMTEEGIEWSNLGATGTLILIPVVLFSLLTQRWLVRGMMQGAVKG